MEHPIQNSVGTKKHQDKKINSSISIPPVKVLDYKGYLPPLLLALLKGNPNKGAIKHQLNIPANIGTTPITIRTEPSKPPVPYPA